LRRHPETAYPGPCHRLRWSRRRSFRPNEVNGPAGRPPSGWPRNETTSSARAGGQTETPSVVRTHRRAQSCHRSSVRTNDQADPMGLDRAPHHRRTRGS
jgi:hypothetical protein